MKTEEDRYISLNIMALILALTTVISIPLTIMIPSSYKFIVFTELLMIFLLVLTIGPLTWILKLLGTSKYNLFSNVIELHLNNKAKGDPTIFLYICYDTILKAQKAGKNVVFISSLKTHSWYERNYKNSVYFKKPSKLDILIYIFGTSKYRLQKPEKMKWIRFIPFVNLVRRVIYIYKKLKNKDYEKLILQVYLDVKKMSDKSINRMERFKERYLEYYRERNNFKYFYIGSSIKRLKKD